MLVCIAAIRVYLAFLQDTAVSGLDPVFRLEPLAPWACGIPTAVKGETLWKDAQGQPA